MRCALIHLNGSALNTLDALALVRTARSQSMPRWNVCLPELARAALPAGRRPTLFSGHRLPLFEKRDASALKPLGTGPLASISDVGAESGPSWSSERPC